MPLESVSRMHRIALGPVTNIRKLVGVDPASTKWTSVRLHSGTELRCRNTDKVTHSRGKDFTCPGSWVEGCGR